jgi:hypothetical protein
MDVTMPPKKTDVKKQDIDQVIQMVDSVMKVEIATPTRRTVRVETSNNSGLKRSELLLLAFFIIAAVILMITATLYLGARIW